MTQASDMGMNRTGIGMAPRLSEEMMRGAETSIPTSGGNGHQIEELRRVYLHDSPPIGTVPPPGTAKGTAKAGMQMLKGNRPSVFLDKLGERLAFERTGTRLYEAVIAKLDVVGTWEQGPTREELMTFHDEELAHFAMVREAIEYLGGDPTVVTPSADISGVVATGVLQVITDPRSSLGHSLQALLVAELADNDGWHMLIRLADAFGQNDLSRRFHQALADEDRHLQSVRGWLTTELEQDLKGGVQAQKPH
ncbi:MAG: ferritin-like domain-containing protein [Thiohalomonadaceae bacterium]